MAEKSKMEGKSCSKVTNNPFFNFLRCYRAQAMNQHCSAVHTAVQGAKIWMKLTAKQREPFEKMAQPLLKPGVVRKPRSGPGRRRARASRSRSRGRRATTRKRSATRRRRSTSRRSTTRRSTRRSATRRSTTRRTTNRRSATRRTTRTSATRRSTTRRTTRRSASRRRKTAAASTRRRSRSRSATKKRAATRQRAGSATKRKATKGTHKSAMAACSTIVRASRKRTKKSRSRSRTRSAPAKRAKRSKKARSTSRKRGRPAGTRGRGRRSKTVKLESFTSPAGCDVCPKPSIDTKTAGSTTTEGNTMAPAVGSVLMSSSINEACNTSMGPAMARQESYENKMVVDDPGSPAQFHLSSDKLILGREMDMNVSTNKRMAEAKKPARNRSVLSEEEAAAGGQESAKRRRR